MEMPKIAHKMEKVKGYRREGERAVWSGWRVRESKPWKLSTGELTLDDTLYNFLMSKKLFHLNYKSFPSSKQNWNGQEGVWCALLSERGTKVLSMRESNMCLTKVL